MKYEPQAFPVEFMTLSNEKGIRLRATVSEFGPILLSRILELNDTQEGLVALIFKYCDDNKLPLLDLKDFIKVLQYISNEGKAEIQQAYGQIATTSTGTILRKVIGLQQQGADVFFGEKSFEVADLMRISDEGLGVVNVLRVTDLQDKPKLFSTFMLQLLAELYASCPEEGDVEKPKLVLFIDEAHLVFQEASDALLKQIETIVKLIRSKGIGIFFCTQNPTDVPPGVLAQLGLKVQHALRAFTANDRKAIKQAAENYPTSTFYKTEDLITELGIGEALVTMLDEKGVPTPLVHCMMAPPRSRMDILTPAEIDAIVSKSKLISKYNQVIDSESAYEILTQKLQDAANKNPAESGKTRCQTRTIHTGENPEQRCRQTGGKNRCKYHYKRSARCIGFGRTEQQFEKVGMVLGNRLSSSPHQIRHLPHQIHHHRHLQIHRLRHPIRRRRDLPPPPPPHALLLNFLWTDHLQHWTFRWKVLIRHWAYYQEPATWLLSADDFA